MENNGAYLNLNLSDKSYGSNKSVELGYKLKPADISVKVGQLRGGEGSILQESPYYTFKLSLFDQKTYNTSSDFIYDLRGSLAKIDLNTDSVYSAPYTQPILTGSYIANTAISYRFKDIKLGAGISALAQSFRVSTNGQLAAGIITAYPSQQDSYLIKTWAITDYHFELSNPQQSRNNEKAYKPYLYSNRYGIKLNKSWSDFKLTFSAEQKNNKIDNELILGLDIITNNIAYYLQQTSNASLQPLFPDSKGYEIGLSGIIPSTETTFKLGYIATNLQYNNDPAIAENKFFAGISIPLYKKPKTILSLYTEPGAVPISSLTDNTAVNPDNYRYMLPSSPNLLLTKQYKNFKDNFINSIEKMPFEEFKNYVKSNVKNIDQAIWLGTILGERLNAYHYNHNEDKVNQNLISNISSQQIYNALQQGYIEHKQIPTTVCRGIARFVSEVINYADIPDIEAFVIYVNSKGAGHVISMLSTKEQVYLIDYGAAYVFTDNNPVKALQIYQAMVKDVIGYKHEVFNENGYVGTIVTPEAKIIDENITVTKGKRAGDFVLEMLKKITTPNKPVKTQTNI